jgi:ABC-type uncharacterized transport system substrate-binding protein
VVESAVEQGELAGAVAERILRGAAPETIPVMIATGGTYMLNTASLEQLGVTAKNAFLDQVEILTGDEQ